jgi:hypothetical protein
MPHDAYDMSEIRNGIVGVVDNAVEILPNLVSDQPNRVLPQRQIEGSRLVAALKLKL